MKHPSHPAELPLKLRQIRLLCELTQVDIANAMDITQGAYHKIETGKTEIKLKHLQIFATCTGLTVDQIITLPIGDIEGLLA